MLQDWNDLDPVNRELVAIEVYTHPELQREWPDGHSKLPVNVAHRSAQIDIPLVSLIQCLWENGFETIACCQDPRSPSNPEAYIGFLSEEHGGRRFMEILANNDIPFSRQDSHPVLKFSIGEVQLRVVSVSFHPSRIVNVQAAINDLSG